MQTPQSPNALATSPGGGRTCALTGSEIVCWGLDFGTGNSTSRRTPTPVAVAGVSGDIRQFVLGKDFGCVLYNTGNLVKCWGRNENGELGQGDADTGRTLETVQIPVSVATLVAGRTAACAIGANGSLTCWGTGYLGDGSHNVAAAPIQVFASGVTSAAIGTAHMCAAFTDDTVKCWGENADGQVGRQDTATALTPVTVLPAGSIVIAVDAGPTRSCARLLAGTKCWGTDAGGLGDGATISSWSPVDVTLVPGLLQQLVLAEDFSCAIKFDDFGLWCWGNNANGQPGPAPRPAASPRRSSRPASPARS